MRVLRFLIFFIVFLSSVLLAEAKILIVGNSKDHGLSQKQVEELERDLHSKTGLESLRFDGRGELVFDLREKAEKGSRKMRQAITGAILDDRNIFEIGDHSNSGKIHFALTDAGTIDVNTLITVYKVQFDFADFKNAERFSDAEVLESYTLGITLFHEIDHKAGYDTENPMPLFGVRPETSSPNTTGVIENVNSVRAELGLILRDTKRIAGRRYGKNMFEIPFLDQSGKKKYLRWEIAGKY